MSAIEYGSYYWCVMLTPTEEGAPGDVVHLHADSVAIDPTGALTFTSVGRRIAGTEPPKGAQNGEAAREGATAESTPSGSAHEAGEGAPSEKGKSGNGHDGRGLIYVAFARGEWKCFYAAKLQDGSPASIEHWSTLEGHDELSALPHHAGAVGFVPAATR